MAAKAKPKSKAKPQYKSEKTVAIKSKAVSKKPVKAKNVVAKKAKAQPKKAKIATKSQPKKKATTKKVSVRTKVTPQKAAKGKAKTVTIGTKTNKSTTSAKKTKPVSKKTQSKEKMTTAPRKVAKTAVDGKKPVAIKAMKKNLSKPGALDESVLSRPPSKAKTSSSAALKTTGAVLPDDIDAELGIQVEGDGDITLESLTSDLDEDSGTLAVDDLDDEFADDDFAEDLADEADEDLDLTEDLAEELGPGKFIREPEGNTSDDEDEIPRSW